MPTFGFLMLMLISVEEEEEESHAEIAATEEGGGYIPASGKAVSFSSAVSKSFIFECAHWAVKRFV